MSSIKEEVINDLMTRKSIGSKDIAQLNEIIREKTEAKVMQERIHSIKRLVVHQAIEGLKVAKYIVYPGDNLPVQDAKTTLIPELKKMFSDGFQITIDIPSQGSFYYIVIKWT